MKPDQAVLRETGRVAAGVFLLVAVMVLVFAAVGRFSPAVILGGIYSGALGVINFFAMGLTVQSVTNQAAERERTEEEIEELSGRMKLKMKVSYNARMIALFALLILALAVFHFDPLATILPVVFPTIVIRFLQILQNRKKSVSEGSDTH